MLNFNETYLFYYIQYECIEKKQKMRKDRAFLKSLLYGLCFPYSAFSPQVSSGHCPELGVRSFILICLPFLECPFYATE